MAEPDSVDNPRGPGDPPAGDRLEAAPISRRVATIANLGYQYLMIGLTLIRGIVLVPYFLRFIGDELYGAWIASVNIMNWLWLSEGGAWLLLRQQVAQEYGARNRHGLAEAIGAGWALLLLPALFLGGAGCALAPLIPGFLNLDDPGKASQLTTGVVIIAIATGLMIVSSGPRAVQQGLQRQVIVNALYLAAEITGLIATIVMLFTGWGLISIPMGILAREIGYNLVVWPLALATLHKLHVRPRVTLARLRSMFGLMSWTFLSNIGETLRQNIDGVVVAKTLGNEVVPITELSKKVWEVSSMVIQRVTGAFTPALAHLHGTGDIDRFRAIAGKLFGSVTIVTALALGAGWAFNADFMRVWVPQADGSSRFAGEGYNVLYGLGTLANLLLFMACEVLFAAGSIRAPAIVRTVQTVARIILVIVLLGVFRSYIAIPISILASMLVGAPLLIVSEWNKTLQLSRADAAGQVAMVLRAAAIAGLLALAWRWIPGPPPPHSWVALLAHGAAFGLIALLLLYAADPFVRESVRSVLARCARPRARTA